MARLDKLRERAAEPADRGDPIVFANLDGTIGDEEEIDGEGDFAVDLDAPIGKEKITTVADDDVDNDPFADKPSSTVGKRGEPDESPDGRENLLVPQDGIFDDEEEAPRQQRNARVVDDPEADFGTDLDIDADLQTITDKALARRITAERRESATLKADATASKAREFQGRKDMVARRITEIDKRLGEIEAQLEAAQEAGESKTVAKLTIEVGGLQAEKRTAVDAKNYYDRQPAPVADEPAKGEAGIGTPVNRLAAAYQDRNPWMKDKRFASQQQALASIDEALFNEGKSPNDPSYYVEMDRRIRAAHPNLPGTPLRGGQNHGQKGRQPVARNGSTGDAPPRNSLRGPTPVTQEDRQTMVRFGLDPRKKSDIVAFATEKRSLARAEAQRRRQQ